MRKIYSGTPVPIVSNAFSNLVEKNIDSLPLFGMCPDQPYPNINPK